MAMANRRPIRVPRTPRKAFDPNRRPSSLLLKQIEHLEWAVLPASRRKPRQLPKGKVKTEGQAAERIGQLTKLVLKADETGAPLAARVLPPLPAARSASVAHPAGPMAKKARPRIAKKRASGRRRKPRRLS
jgi:hypothetical protein